MDMEGLGMEEKVGSCNYNDATRIRIIMDNKYKGKRTRRLRPPLSPCATVMSTCTSSTSTASGDGGGDYCGSFSSSTTTFDEDQDMANCLILLAQGQRGADAHRRRDGTAGKIGFYSYECKTCNQKFPSFQALGGHRASHKKPKLTMPEGKKTPSPPPTQLISTNCEFQEAGQIHDKVGPPIITPQLGCKSNTTTNFHGNRSSKVHECSICGSEFASGQALGGHMRRHRKTTNTIETNCNTATATRNVLELDLNLPAPEEDLLDSKFFQMLPASPALVGCELVG